MKIAICDDEEIFREQLVHSIQKYQEKRFEIDIFTYHSGEELLKNIEQNFDLLFLDIEMDKISGIDVKETIQSCRKDTRIVFVSSYSERMPDAFGENVLGFLVKPTSEEEIWHYISYVEKRISEDEVFCFHDTNGFSTLKSSEIVYIQADGKYTRVFSKDQSYFDTHSLNVWEKRLNPECFCRVHKSYIVHFSCGHYLGNKQIFKTCSGDEIPVARMRNNTVKERYFIFLKNHSA